MITLPIEYRKRVANYSNFSLLYSNVEFLEDFGPWNAGETISQLDFNLLSGYITDGKGRSMIVKAELVS